MALRRRPCGRPELSAPPPGSRERLISIAPPLCGLTPPTGSKPGSSNLSTSGTNLHPRNTYPCMPAPKYFPPPPRRHLVAPAPTWRWKQVCTHCLSRENQKEWGGEPCDPSGRTPGTAARNHSGEDVGSGFASKICCQALYHSLPFIFTQRHWMAKSFLLSFNHYYPYFLEEKTESQRKKCPGSYSR